MGLITPTELIGVEQLPPVHFIAIGGSGMNGIASAFLDLGYEVSGSDRQDSGYLQALTKRGARTYVGHAAEQLGDARTVIASSAIREDNPELAEARARGLRVLHRSEALGSLMLGRRGVAVAGTHGKTTTTAMIARVLTEVGADPSYLIGGSFLGSKTGGHIGSGDAMVVEADESDGSFLQYPAEVAVVTNVDPDHLTNWGTPAAYADGFVRFATKPELKLLVVSADDPGAVELVKTISTRTSPELVEGAAAPEIITFGLSETADLRLTDLELAGGGSTFTLTDTRRGTGGQVRLTVPARYNALNAAATYAVATYLGGDDAAVRAALGQFGGTHRRFELIGTVNDVRVYDDYSHHPTEVANMLTAARPAAGDGRVVICFQPHLYTRTRDFWREFAAALEVADEVIVMDVCGDREDPIEGITGALVADAIRPGTATVTYQPVWDEAAPTVAGIARPGDVVVTVGCGDVTKVAPKIVDELRRRYGS
ncbi:UDP-N-acetylmuramate--L-alanine ligase [Microlunatus speluncae]|uniref:UDP-N-acetylmuramate--L-alanine ligase n=1 Tax=Microlunatus speluncae TaxID=2594267 RepID=UPI001266635B|nr:UDP-N-acetylmuramate--L-alanine ligase [Microlunatus speluncae]